jgi:UDP-glucuronate decarboxylase
VGIVSQPMELLVNCSILITGATGLLGSMIVKTLAQASFDLSLNLHIIVMARNETKLKKMFEGCNVEILCGDICDAINVSNKLDYIIHCAAATTSREMITHPVENLLTSIEGTKNILELAKSKEIKSMVFVSSMEMYGTNAVKGSEKVTEDKLGTLDLTNPRASYPEGKRAAECFCFAYRTEYGIPVKVARLAQTFGAGVAKEENRVFAQFAKSAIQGADIVLHTDGSSEGNYCYLADAVYGILTILLKGRNGEAYNVANENLHMTIKQMAKIVAKDIADGKIGVSIDIPEDSAKLGYAPKTKLNISSEKLRALGWKPKYNMRDMYERMIEYWKE